ncbi:MAG TPA: hypothetical protein VM778_12545, partial [Gemmatimonadota bacterium]|nr:hypothetical protein [Gemmatimonadota bacterium]
MIHYLVRAPHERGIREYLQLWGLPLAERFEVIHYESLPDRDRLEPGTWILAGLDQLGPAMLRLVVEIHRRLEDDPTFRFLNHPTRTLRRFDLLGELHRRGLNEFRAIRATADLRDLRFPVFLRSAVAHDGAISPLLRSIAAVEQAIGRALVRGRRLEDLLVVEFCDTSDGEGTFRKYGAYIVADRFAPRHVVRGTAWMLKLGHSNVSRESVMEEREYILSNPHREQLEEIVRIAGVGYGRIDYGLLNGRVQTWEINLNPVIGRGLRPPSGVVPDELRVFRDQQKRPFYDLLQAGFEAVDLPGGGPARAIDVDPALARAARAETARPRRAV